MVSFEELKSLVGDVLQISSRLGGLGEGAALLGSIPEFDSMAIVSVLTAIEDNYGIMVDDDEISAETFETFGSLLQFVNSKVE